MMKKMLAAIISATMLSLTGSVLPADALETQPHELTESEALELVCAELGIADFDAYVADLAARLGCDSEGGGLRDPDPDDLIFNPNHCVDIYTGGNSNGVIDTMDAGYLLQFLNGTVDYPYDYNDLDAYEDHIIDRMDAEAFLQCYAVVVVLQDMPNFVPSTHGVARTIVNAYENRSYTKFISATYQTTSYSLTLSQLNTSANTFEDNLWHSTGIQGTNRATNSVYDSRIVRIGTSIPLQQGGFDNNFTGTGFIIAPHLIATAAHCVYQYSPPTNIQQNFVNGFNKYRAVFACLNASSPTDFTNNCTKLNVLSVHIPNLYKTNDETQKKKYDYALIVVENDLTQYGYFGSCSLVLDDSPNTEYLTSPHPAITKGMYNTGSVPNHFLSINTSLTAINLADTPEGGYQVRPYTYNSTPGNTSARSGGVSYFPQSEGYSVDSVFGIITRLGPGGSYDCGTIITRPLLQFYRNNPNVT